MIDLYFWPTGDGKKIVILLEELGVPVQNREVGRGEPNRGVSRGALSAECSRIGSASHKQRNPSHFGSY